MLTKTRGTPVRSPAPGVIPDTITGPVGNGSSGATDPGVGTVQASAVTANGTETRAEHLRRKALRGRLHGYAVAAVALVAVLIALAASNTAHVKVSWLVGSSHVSLVWLVLAAAILGWLLGLMTSARLRWRTRAPRPQRGARS
ncbi:MAG: LapA family protein [Solirubrobacteraceae bacterium]|jgi:uncharacterized integral membrane protein